MTKTTPSSVGPPQAPERPHTAQDSRKERRRLKAGADAVALCLARRSPTTGCAGSAPNACLASACPQGASFRHCRRFALRAASKPAGREITVVVHHADRCTHEMCCCRFATGTPRLSGIANGPPSSGTQSTGKRTASCSSSTLPGPSTTFGFHRGTDWRSFVVTWPVDIASGSTTSGASASAGRQLVPRT